ncbi:MAG: hypothetical protein QGH20_02160 [Candidatus Latescibacteria bacterium]|jgi:hypothetical protein|nr:hypothetical protein [Candidatus Latescibacterota bacterium]
MSGPDLREILAAGKLLERSMWLPRIALAATVVLILTVALLPSRRTEELDAIRQFQSLVGGAGMGAISTPMWCFLTYDPRLEAICTCIEWPIPGGYCYCPDHTASVSYFEEARRSAITVTFLPP